jgi:putative endonuclease
VKGADAEDRALAFLAARGLVLVVRNFRCRGGELDLVLRDGATLAIVEVRKRSHPGFASAAESVDLRKRRRLLLAAQAFLAARPEFSRAPLRFDVVTLDAGDRIEWLRAAFDGGDA